ncbi:hypothetical protein CKA32_003816 [Geitlerinema sp. FC II]|nr:hypothetical protein CKA32_003816 [Geitlerinema sp. FC II]
MRVARDFLPNFSPIMADNSGTCFRSIPLKLLFHKGSSFIQHTLNRVAIASVKLVLLYQIF